MRKFFILIVIFFIPIAVTAKTFDAKISYDWVKLAKNDRITLVHEIVNSLSKSDFIPDKFSKQDFKNTFAVYLKDKDSKLHYIQAKNKIKNTNEYKISGFFKGNMLILYALQYDNDLHHNFYYDVFGNLRFVDFISDEYPAYPYYSKQFYRNGNTVAYFYYLSDNMQFIFDSNFNFKGVWQNEKMYDLNGNVLLTRGEYSY